MGTFQYEALNSNSSFRIAILQPGTAGDDIRISLLHADFDQKCTYQALSYVWGDPSVTRSISCEGQSFNITVNLFLALRRLRYEDKPRHLWIDAICINQSSNLEREQQISCMRDIYSRASKVIIWTGEDENSANSAHQLAGLLLHVFRDNPNFFTEDPAQRLAIRNIIRGHKCFREHVKSAVAFLGNEWFRRVWTYQEAYLSQDAEVVCGKVAFPWKPFVFSWSLLEILGIKLPLDGMESAKTVFATYIWASVARVSLTPMSLLARASLAQMSLTQVSLLARASLAQASALQPESRLRLSNLMRSTYTHLSSDPRDRIFGLLAMVQPRDGIQFRPDYNATVEDVYIGYARLMIQDDGHLQILSDAQGKGHDPSLPSWVPDWREKIRVNPLAERIRTFKPKYHLHRGFHPQDIITPTDDPRKLKLRGARVGNIQKLCFLGSLTGEVGQTSVKLGTWRGVVCEFRQFYDMINALILDLPPIYNHTGESTFSAFVRTLAGDYLPFSDRVSEDDYRHYFPCCHDYRSLTWKECFRPLYFDAESMGDSPCTSVAGAPVQEVLDLLFDRRRPPKLPTKPWCVFGPLKVDIIYTRITVEIHQVIQQNSGGRLIYVTDNGYLGIGPNTARVGDPVYDLLGGDVPFVLRETENPNEFTLLGDSYIHGVMDGELWRLASDGRGLESVDGTLNFEEIVLV